MKKEIYICPKHKKELYQATHGWIEDRYICIEYGCGYSYVTEGTEPDLTEKEY